MAIHKYADSIDEAIEQLEIDEVVEEMVKNESLSVEVVASVPGRYIESIDEYDEKDVGKTELDFDELTNIFGCGELMESLIYYASELKEKFEKCKNEKDGGDV